MEPKQPVDVDDAIKIHQEAKLDSNNEATYSRSRLICYVKIIYLKFIFAYFSD